MRVNVEALRQQTWRAEKLFIDFTLFAISIGCQVVQDEVISDTAAKERLLAAWWKDHTS